MIINNVSNSPQVSRIKRAPMQANSSVKKMSKPQSKPNFKGGNFFQKLKANKKTLSTASRYSIAAGVGLGPVAAAVDSTVGIVVAGVLTGLGVIAHFASKK